MSRPRKNHTPEEKVSILRMHLLEKIPVSDLCNKFNVHPTMFYKWQKILFENGQAAFEQPMGKAEERKITALEDKLRRKDEVLSELMEEHVALKKSLGGL